MFTTFSDCQTLTSISWKPLGNVGDKTAKKHVAAPVTKRTGIVRINDNEPWLMALGIFHLWTTCVGIQ